MEDSLIAGVAPAAKRAIPYIVAVVVGGAGIGYAVHEHRSAQTLATQNSQVTAQLSAATPATSIVVILGIRISPLGRQWPNDHAGILWCLDPRGYRVRRD